MGEIAERFGRQCTVLAIDAARRDGRLEVLVKGGREGTGIDAVAWARDGTARGAGEILLDQLGPGRHARGLRPRPHPGDRRRGPRAGDRLGRRRGPEHLKEAFDAGADAVLAASIFHDGELTVADVKRALADLGVPIRP